MNLTQKEQVKFINQHLYNELRYLFCAAASWEKAKIKSNKRKFPEHFIDFTMDSAFLHARSLFEFFTYKQQKKKRSSNLVIWKDFGLKKRLESQDYTKTWMDPLHRYLFHLQNRDGERNMIKGKPLKNMVMNIASEIFKLTQTFSDQLENPLQQEMRKTLRRSLNRANDILPSFETKLYKHD